MVGKVLVEVQREPREESISGKRNLGPFPELTSRNIFLRRSMEREYTCALKVYKDKKPTILKPENCFMLVSGGVCRVAHSNLQSSFRNHGNTNTIDIALSKSMLTYIISFNPDSNPVMRRQDKLLATFHSDAKTKQRGKNIQPGF